MTALYMRKQGKNLEALWSNSKRQQIEQQKVKM